MKVEIVAPPGGSSASANIGTNGQTAPTSSGEIGFIDATGKLQGVSPSNPLPVDIHIDTVTVSENIAQINGATVNVGTGASSTGTMRVAVSSDSSLSVSGNVTVVQPTGTNLHTVIDSGTVTAAQATASALNATVVGTGTFATQVTSLPALPTGANTIGAISNTSFAATQATASALNATVVGTGTFTTQVSSSALPTGAATSANQTTLGSQTTKLNDGTNTAAVKAASTAAVAADPALVVAISPNNTVAVSGNVNPGAPTFVSSTAALAASASYTSPSFNTANGQSMLSFSIFSVTAMTAVFQESSDNTNWSSTDTYLIPAGGANYSNHKVSGQYGRVVVTNGASANAGGVANLNIMIASSSTGSETDVTIVDAVGNNFQFGQTTMSKSFPVTLASDQSSVPVAQSGFAAANAPVYNVYSSTNITTLAYVQLIASTTSATKYIDIFDSSGQAMILAVGGAGSEVIQAYIPPGGDSFSFAIPAGSRVAYKALTATASSGYLLLNLRG
jgi:hypothetical protein